MVLIIGSFGETAIFTKFHLFLSKKRGGVNTGGREKFSPGPLLDSDGLARL
jgi:hypothetical protein